MYNTTLNFIKQHEQPSPDRLEPPFAPFPKGGVNKETLKRFLTQWRYRNRNSWLQKSLLPFLILVCCNGLAEAGQRVLVVQSLSVATYEEALSRFKSVCDAWDYESSSFRPGENQPFQLIQFNKPELILAIGMDALTEIKEIEDIPIIYMMVLNPQAITFGEKNISGISMTSISRKAGRYPPRGFTSSTKNDRYLI